MKKPWDLRLYYVASEGEWIAELSSKVDDVTVYHGSFSGKLPEDALINAAMMIPI